MPSNKPGYQKKYFAKWYKKNRKTQIANTSARRERMRVQNQAQIALYLLKHPCVDCGENDIVVLQFDHVRGKKKYDISKMIGTGYPWALILKEIAKCEVRCANDHVRRTSKVQNSYRTRVSP